MGGVLRAGVESAAVAMTNVLVTCVEIGVQCASRLGRLHSTPTLARLGHPDLTYPDWPGPADCPASRKLAA